MSGNKIGGLKAAKTNLKKNPDFYRIIGSKGGRAGNTGGFHAHPELASEAGRKGGKNSSRKGVKNGEGKKNPYVYSDDSDFNWRDNEQD